VRGCVGGLYGIVQKTRFVVKRPALWGVVVQLAGLVQMQRNFGEATGWHLSSIGKKGGQSEEGSRGADCCSKCHCAMFTAANRNLTTNHPFTFDFS